MKDVRSIAQTVSEEQGDRFYVSEKAAHGVLHDRLIKGGYEDTIAEVDIAIRYGTMKVRSRVDLLVKGRLLVELKLRNNIREEQRQQLKQYMDTYRCDYGLLVVFPKSEDGHFRVERCTRDFDMYTGKVEVICKAFNP